jgi:probable HAF family extracellular repeat protein
MTTRSPSFARAIGAISLTAALLTTSCAESDDLMAPSLEAAKAGAGPKVASVVPDSSERGVRINLTVNGSGFDQGSTMTLERQGVPAAGITTNATTYVSSRKLIADVTIAAAADTGKYDVAVTTSGGRKGVGIELFEVKYEIAELGMFGGTWSIAHAVNDQGEIVGESCTQECLSRAFRWTEATGLEDLGTLPGYTRSGAFAVDHDGRVFGRVECRSTDPGCGATTQRQLVRWDRVGGSWAITPVQGCSVVSPLGDASRRFLINNREQCVGRSVSGSGELVVQTLSGGSVVNEASLPSLAVGGFTSASAISDAPMVAGVARGTGSFPDPVVWYRSPTGAWVILRLGVPGTYLFASATDLSDPDAGGRVRVTGWAQHDGKSRREQYVRPLRWTLQGDGVGGWHVVSTEVVGSTPQSADASSGWAAAINENGDMVGIAGGFVESGDPIEWPIGGGIEQLPIFGGGAQGRAMDINSSGWIVGSVWDQGNACDRAAVWRKE